MEAAGALTTDARFEHAFNRAWTVASRRLGGPADLAFLFCSSEYETDPEAIEAALRPLGPGTAFVGGATSGVIGAGREVEEDASVSVLAFRLGEGRAVPFSLTNSELSLIDDPALTRKHLGLEYDDPALLILFCDPYSFDAAKALGILDRAFQGAPVVGGLIGGASTAGTATLVGPDGVRTVGATGVALVDVQAQVVVAQGCRPIGDPLLITRAERNLIYELGRRPAFDVLRETVEAITPAERTLIGGALHIGRVINEYSDEFQTGDFLVRNLIGADPDKGLIAIGDVVRSGQTVQFHVRDRGAAEREMRRLIRTRAPAITSILEAGGGCLMFNCAGRGSTMFGLPDHDVLLLTEETGAGGPVTGCFCAGEIGPVGRTSFVHGFASVISAIGPA